MKTLRPGEIATELLRAGKQLTVSVSVSGEVFDAHSEVLLQLTN